MSDNDNKHVIDFEEIFKEENNKQPNKKSNDYILKNSNTNILTILIYTIMFFIGFAGLFAQLIVKPIKPKTTDYVALSKLVDRNSNDYLALVSKELFEIEKDKFTLKNNKEFISFTISNESYNNYLFVSITNSESDIEFLNQVTNLDGIISGEIIKWPEEKRTITVIYADYKDISNNFKSSSNYINAGTLTNLKESIINFLAYFIVIIPLVIINKKEMIDDYTYFKKEYHPVASKLLTGLAMMLAVSFALGLISTQLGNLLNVGGVSDNQNAIEALIKSNGFIFMAISVVIFAPVVEELVFRKAIFGLIKDDRTAIIVSALSFGFLHLTMELIGLSQSGGFNLTSILHIIILSIPYVGIGAFLGYWYSKNNRNLTLLIAMHALSNLLSVLVLI